MALRWMNQGMMGMMEMDSDAQVENCYFPMQRAQIRDRKLGRLEIPAAAPKNVMQKWCTGALRLIDIWLQDAGIQRACWTRVERTQHSCRKKLPLQATSHGGKPRRYRVPYRGRFIPKCYMEKESDHLEDFAPELAMVTKFGNEEPSHPWSLEVWFNGSNMFKCNYAHILYMFNGHRRSSLQSHTHIHIYIYIFIWGFP